MSERAYSATIIRYTQDPLRGEFVNVGLVLVVAGVSRGRGKATPRELRVHFASPEAVAARVQTLWRGFSPHAYREQVAQVMEHGREYLSTLQARKRWSRSSAQICDRIIPSPLALRFTRAPTLTGTTHCADAKVNQLRRYYLRDVHPSELKAAPKLIVDLWESLDAEAFADDMTDEEREQKLESARGGLRTTLALDGCCFT